MFHSVKIEPECLEKITKGEKTYDIRKKDRDYRVGDCIALNEYKRGEYTGRFMLVDIVSIDEYPLYLDSDYVILQLKPLGLKENINSFDCYANYERFKGEN